MKNLLLSILAILTVNVYGQLVPTTANVSAPQPPSITGGTGNIFANSVKNTKATGYAAFAATVGGGFGAGYTSLFGTDPDKNAYIYNSRGVLLPRLTYAQRIAVSSPQTGLTVFQTNTSGLNTKGYYYYDGSAWVQIASGSGSSYWSRSGETVSPTTATDTVSFRKGKIGTQGDTLFVRQAVSSFPYSGFKRSAYGFNRLIGDLNLAGIGQDSSITVGGYFATDFSTGVGLFTQKTQAQMIAGEFVGAKTNLVLYPPLGGGSGVNQYFVLESKLCNTCSNVGTESQLSNGRINWLAYVDSSAGAGNDAFLKLDWNKAFVGGSSLTSFNVDADSSVFTGSVQISELLTLGAYTVAGLPAGVVGQTCYVTDALGPVSLSNVVGGGTVKVPVFFDGTNWIVF